MQACSAPVSRYEEQVCARKDHSEIESSHHIIAKQPMARAKLIAGLTKSLLKLVAADFFDVVAAGAAPVVLGVAVAVAVAVLGVLLSSSGRIVMTSPCMVAPSVACTTCFDRRACHRD